MGCDIHLYVEVRKNGVWAFHDHEKPYRTGKDEDGEDVNEDDVGYGVPY